jgi:hypothetical protein
LSSFLIYALQKEFFFKKGEKKIKSKKFVEISFFDYSSISFLNNSKLEYDKLATSNYLFKNMPGLVVAFLL